MRIVLHRKSVVATARRRERVYKRTAEPSVPICEEEAQRSDREAIFQIAARDTQLAPTSGLSGKGKAFLFVAVTGKRKACAPITSSVLPSASHSPVCGARKNLRAFACSVFSTAAPKARSLLPPPAARTCLCPQGEGFGKVTQITINAIRGDASRIEMRDAQRGRTRGYLLVIAPPFPSRTRLETRAREPKTVISRGHRPRTRMETRAREPQVVTCERSHPRTRMVPLSGSLLTFCPPQKVRAGRGLSGERKA